MAASRETVVDTFRIPDALWERIEPLLPKVRSLPQGGTAALAPTPGVGRHFLRPAYRRPLEGRPARVRLRQQSAPLLPTLAKAGAVPPAVAKGLARVRRQDRHRLGMAEPGTGPWPRPHSGGKKTGKNPTDRAKKGTKRSLLTDGRGVPLGLEVAGANRADMKLVEATLDSIPIERPEPRRRSRSTFWGTRGMTTPRCGSWWPAGVTQPTSRSRSAGGPTGRLQSLFWSLSC